MGKNLFVRVAILNFYFIITPSITENAKCFVNNSLHENIYIKYGDSLNVLCSLDDVDEEETSKHLYFFVNNQRIPDNGVKIINSSSIGLFVEKPPKSKSDYTCLLEESTSLSAGGSSKLVCSSTVIVDSKPNPVNDLKCVSYNLESLTCTWTPINSSFAEIHYDIKHYFLVRRGMRLYRDCADLIVDTNSNKFSCTWTIFSEPQYRSSYLGTFHFELTMTNVFGKTVVTKDISHSAIVVPNPPQNLVLSNKTAESILLSWTVPNELHVFPIGLQHKIIYRSEYDEDNSWHTAAYKETNKNTNNKPVILNITNLKYAYTNYDIRISMRSSLADKDDEAMWSRSSSITVRTMPKIPTAPPRTNVGSFELISSSGRERNVHIYWQQIKDEMKNGENFTYHIELTEIDRVVNRTIDPVRTYAEFKILNNDQIFNIWSSNALGRTKAKSTIYIPARSKLMQKPSWFTRTEFPNGKYSLSWEPAGESTTTYSIFWCAYDEVTSHKCESSLDWLEVPSNQTSFNTTLKRGPHRFAISANSKTSSSGMVWACPIIYGKTISQLRGPLVDPVNSTAVKITWMLVCSDGIASVAAFVVYYCRISNESNQFCIEPEEKLVVGGHSTTTSVELNGLNSSTPYMVAVSVVNKDGLESLKSKYQSVLTLEGAPNPPINLEALIVTNSSIFFVWEEPKDFKEKIISYKIKYNGTVDGVITETIVEKEYSLTNLTSYVIYNIVVQACSSTMCSKDSELLQVKTKGGYPSKLLQPRKFTSENSTDCKVKWESPSEPNGNNGTYQLIFKVDDSDSIVNVTDTEYIFEECGANLDCRTLEILVRAVNVFEENTFYGPWSEQLTLPCALISSSSFWILIAALFLLLLLIFIYILKHAYFHCQEMRKIEIVLPAGIETILEPKFPSGGKSIKKQSENQSSEDGELYQMIKLTKENDSKDNSRRVRKCSIEDDLERLPSSASIDSLPQNSCDNYCTLGIDNIPFKKNFNPNYVSAEVVQKQVLGSEEKGPDIHNLNSNGYVKTGELSYLSNSDSLS